MMSSASARSMSLLVMPPTPRWMTRSEMSSSTSIFISASSSASPVPELSPLRVRVGWPVPLRGGAGLRPVVAALHLPHRLFERLDGARVVALDDQVELTGLLERGVEVLEADPLAHGGVLRVADAGLAAVGGLPGHPVLLDDEERVTGARHRGEPD